MNTSNTKKIIKDKLKELCRAEWFNERLVGIGFLLLAATVIIIVILIVFDIL